jgi:hypothetical protein
MGFLSALTILFVGLKLTAFIAWPWWVVLSPLWGGVLLVLLLALAVAATK